MNKKRFANFCKATIIIKVIFIVINYFKISFFVDLDIYSCKQVLFLLK